MNCAFFLVYYTVHKFQNSGINIGVTGLSSPLVIQPGSGAAGAVPEGGGCEQASAELVIYVTGVKGG